MKLKSNPWSYRRRLPHLQRTGKPLFITFHTLGFRPLPSEARDIVLACCRYEHSRRVHLYATVVMPEHVHLLLVVLCDERGDEFVVRTILQAIKGASAHRINQLLGRSGPVWEEESFDHVLRSDEQLREKLEYIELNPVRRGIVDRPELYPWLWVNPEFAP